MEHAENTLIIFVAAHGVYPQGRKKGPDTRKVIQRAVYPYVREAIPRTPKPPAIRWTIPPDGCGASFAFR